MNYQGYTVVTISGPTHVNSPGIYSNGNSEVAEIVKEENARVSYAVRTRHYGLGSRISDKRNNTEGCFRKYAKRKMTFKQLEEDKGSEKDVQTVEGEAEDWNP